MSGLRRVPSETICEVLDEYGGHGRIAVPQDFHGLYQRARESGPLGVDDGPVVCAASELAAARIRELEDSLARIRDWRHDVLVKAGQGWPDSIEAENWMGWRLLCESARENHRDLIRWLATTVGEQVRKEIVE